MSHIHDDTIKDLEVLATEIRKDIIKMLLAAGSGHPAGSLGMTDVFTALYFHILHHDPNKPLWDDRDRLILSNGHICPARYAAMAHAGYFPKEELLTLRELDSRMQGHPERPRLPALESTSGPLGAGLAQATGLAYASMMDDKKWRTYCLTSDGEHEAGMHWEAVLFAGKYKLPNLTNIVDRNNIQIEGTTEDVMPLEPLRQKYESFNWHVIDIDGHNIEEIIDACNQAKSITEKPTCILAHTIPGRGVDFMENEYEWHGKSPNREQADDALRQLEEIKERLISDHE